MNKTLPPELLRILVETPALRDAFLVGGCVRDWLLGIPHKDYDIEVFGLTFEQLVAALEPWGRVDLVGRSFGVAKLTTPNRTTFDFTIPRRDSKTAPGHKGFAISFDSGITPRDAAARRDYTVNSLMWDPQEERLLDFFGGEADLRNRILRHTSEAFPEDPLRVLRGMQFASRFSLTPAPETVALARSIKHTHSELARERIREEWFKWAEKGTTPSYGLRFLAQSEWIEHYPEINQLQGTPQDPLWHPEGDVFTHTCHCCDAMATLPEWKSADVESRIVYMLATLTHDFGKTTTTHQAVKDGETRIVSPGHEFESGPLALRFLDRINTPLAIRDRVIPLVLNHMAHFDEVSERAVRRLSKRLEPENIDGLLLLMTADSMGRPPLAKGIPETVQKIAHKAEELAVRKQAPTSILLGRHLLNLGMAPGPHIGRILHAAFDAQLNGSFRDLAGAHRWLLHESGLSLPSEIRKALSHASEQ